MPSSEQIDRQFGFWATFRPSLARPVIALSRAVLPVLLKGTDGVCRRDLCAQGCRMTLLSAPGAGQTPCLVYFHGGGFVFDAAPYHYRNAAAYARGAHCKVLLVRYPLAPRHPIGEIVSACRAALLYALENARALGTDGRVAVGGDSAGGYLAADAALFVRAPLRLAMLLYPVVGGGETPSMRAYPDTPMWNARLNRRMWEYVGDAPSVLQHDLSSFPPAFVETAQFDCLHDEGAALAARLREAGRQVAYTDRAGAMHGFDIAQRCAVTRAALAERIAALRAAFET